MTNLISKFKRIWNYFWKIRIFNFMFVGGLGFLVNIAIYYPLTVLIHDKVKFMNQVFYLPALFITAPIVLLFNYSMNKRWTYRDCPAKSLSLARYEIMGLLSVCLDITALFLLVQFGHVYWLLAMVIATILMFGLRYFISNKWIWKTTKVKTSEVI